MHTKVTLKNGLRIILIPRKETEAVTVLAVFAVGSRDEEENLAGISHMLEHMHYKGAKRRKTPLEIAEFIDNIGGEHNAFTSKEYTGYFAKVTSEHLLRAIDFISDNVCNSQYPAVELEKERQVILEELKMYEDMPQQKVGELYEESAFGSNPLGRSIIGRRESLKTISRNDLINYQKNHYSNKNAVIAVAGNFAKISNEKICQEIEKKFTFSDQEKINVYKLKIPTKPKAKIIKKKTEQSNIAVGFYAPSLRSDEWYGFKLLTIILGGSMSSRMFTEIREKRGLAYYIKSAYGYFTDSGIIATQAGVDNMNCEKALEAILAEYRKIVENKISEGELNKAKEIIKGGINIDLEDSEELALEYAMTELLNKLETPDEAIKKFEAVSAEEIQKLAKNYFDFDKIIFSAVGPKIDRGKIEKVLRN